MTIRIYPNQPLDINIFADKMVSAIVLSLFCDARGKNDRGTIERGWWAEGLIETDFRFGSLFWLLRRSKNMAETLRNAEDYANNALRWMMKDGVATTITATASAPHTEMLLLQIIIDAQKYELEVINAY